MFLAVVCTVILGLGRTIGNMILALLSMVIALVARDPGNNIDDRRAQMLVHLPSNMKQALARFKLDGRTTVYATCPTCHCTYEPTFDSLSSDPIYPERCTNVPEPGQTVCDAPLLHPRDSDDAVRKPLKPFVYQHFNDYLAGLLSDERTERAMDLTCAEFMKNKDQSASYTSNMFEAAFMKDFYLDKDRRTLFLDCPGSEGRYAFAFFVDFFSPEGKSLHNAFASLGIIAMACLNLPPDIRYKPENMYLAGIVPGPEEPKLEKLNHYIRPLITDMKKSWTDGVFLSRTAVYPDGRLTRCAIAVGVFDLPAGRKTAALAGHGADWFCSICDLNGRAKHLHRTDYENWRRRDPEQLRHWAEKWRDAESASERTKIFQTHGVRWSELWRLPYWDPTRMLVIDAMHCLYEGLIKMHCHEALDLSVANATKANSEVPAFSWPFKAVTPEESVGWSAHDIKHVRQIHNSLQGPIAGSDSKAQNEAFQQLHLSLFKRNNTPLAFVCQDLACVPSSSRPKKADYVESLIAWRRKQPLNSSPLDPATGLVNDAVISRIREVISDIVKPSWLNSLPSDLGVMFGTKGAGSLKADEWRVFFTIILPVALISLWGEGFLDPMESTSTHRREVLDHTMALVQAVLVAGLHYTTPRRTAAYLEYIRQYVSKLHVLYPHIAPRTNEHVAFHIYDFLLSYGPVRSWWCFPFERLVGVLQNLPSNHKFGTYATSSLTTHLLMSIYYRANGRILDEVFHRR